MGTAVSTLLQDVTFRLVRDDVSNAQIIRRINWAVQDIGAKYFVPELEGVVTYTANTTATNKTKGYLSIATTNKLRWVISVCSTYSSWGNLVMASPTVAAGFSDAITGTPTYWYHFGNKIFTWPYCGATHTKFEVRFRKHPTIITSTSTTNDLPTYLDEAIVNGACYMLLRDLNENENALIAYKQYMGQLKQLKPYQAEEFAMSRQVTQVKQ